MGVFPHGLRRGQTQNGHPYRVAVQCTVPLTGAGGELESLGD